MDSPPTKQRLQALVRAGIALTSELSLDTLLRRLIETAAELTGARYAALGVVDPSGSHLERFVSHGVDDETVAAIGDLPQGRGILGVLLRETKPLRLHDLTEDPRSVGFPPGHPPMTSFLGVPILLRGLAYGNLYLTEKEGGDFTVDDEELVTLLAAQAAVAIENVRLFEAATRWSAQLESLNEIGNALASEPDLERLLDLIARRLRELLGARFVTVILPSGPDELRFAAVAGEGGADLLGQTIPRSESKSGRVLEQRRSERVDSILDDADVDPGVSRRLGARTGLWVPLIVREEPIGVLAAHDKLGNTDARFSDDDLRLAETFAARAAVAVDLSDRVARDSLRRVVAAQELERRRLARELHDETGQALTSILLGLRALEDSLESPESRAAAADLRELAVGTLQDVRRLAVELRPKALDDFGLISALERLTETWGGYTGISVNFAASLGEHQLSNEAATALYRIVQEALTNVVKHAHAENASVLLTRKNGMVVAVIEDDGRGFDPSESRQGFGIQGMRERVELLGGRLQVESAPGTGTTLVAEVPLA
ncbi:MAG TPA: GAF domain-containing protein [Gaiellaceae bacterium]|jgi:signal transduction histidine kinase